MMRAVVALLAAGIIVAAVLILRPAHTGPPRNQLNVIVVPPSP